MIITIISGSLSGHSFLRVIFRHLIGYIGGRVRLIVTKTPNRMRILDLNAKYNLLNQVLPFPDEWKCDFSTMKKRYPPIQNLARYYKIDLKIRGDESIEDRNPDQEGAKYVYDFIFQNANYEGEVLFIDADDKAVILESSQLKSFFIEDYFTLKGEYPNINFSDFYFIFLDQKQIFAFEHPGITYNFSTQF